MAALVLADSTESVVISTATATTLCAFSLRETARARAVRDPSSYVDSAKSSSIDINCPTSSNRLPVSNTSMLMRV